MRAECRGSLIEPAGRKATNDEDRFWALIGLLDWDRTGDDDAVVKPVIDAHAQLPVEELQALEAILYVAAKAHERRTGTEWDYHAPVSYETFSNERGWADA